MPEPTDAILPILQKIQTDIADAKRDLGGKIDGVGTRVDALTTRMDYFEDYFTYTMGLTQQNKVDIKGIRAEIAEIKARLNGPEAPS
jgi:hypothetical protein